jgi:hypothetical protein
MMLPFRPHLSTFKPLPPTLQIFVEHLFSLLIRVFGDFVLEDEV